MLDVDRRIGNQRQRKLRENGEVRGRERPTGLRHRCGGRRRDPGRDRPMANRQPLKVSLLVFFGLILCFAVFGIFWRPDNTSTFLTIFIFITGAIVLVALSNVLESLSVGPKGIEAKLHRVEQQQQEIVQKQQEIVNYFVKYSLAEIIYRELLWKITRNIEVKADRTPDQIRWLTLLFDHGLLQSRDMTTWLEFSKIEEGKNLCELFKATPAAERLVDLRGDPT
jgi:hypothetical protein